MQAFLPYPSYAESAKVLDYRRLGNQRKEALQMLAALTGRKVVGSEHELNLITFEPVGWVHHTATRMWRGIETALVEYCYVIIDEWTNVRGYRDVVCRRKLQLLFPDYVRGTAPTPPWLGNEALHASHRSNLLRKNPAWYQQFGWAEPPDLPYVWPN